MVSLKMKYYYFILLLLLSSNCLTIDDYEQCSIRDSCSNSSLISPSIYNDEIFIRSRNCFCDSACKNYGDCCNGSKLNHSDYYECIDFLSPTIKEKIPQFNPLFIWMRTECLPIYIGSRSDIECRNLNKQTFLNNPLLFIPVTSLQTNITYRNYYCAYCNNDANFDIQFWEYKAFCHGNGSIFDKIILNKEEQVNYYIHNLTQNCPKTIIYPRTRGSSEPSVFIRPCKKSLPPKCPFGTSTDLDRNCSLSSTSYRYDLILNVTYPNPYCAECNKKPTSEITCSDPTVRSGISIMPHQRVHPLSILFDPNFVKRYLNNNSSTEMIYSLGYNCTQSNELYNLFLKKCSPITNSNKQIIISLKCLHPIETSENVLRYNNGSLYLINHSILLTKDQYVFINDHQIIFCADQWKTTKPTIPFYRNILSIICTSISLVCIMIFIIAFWLIPSLHNLPGKSLLFLSISIFLGQLTFISTSDLIQYSSLCFISAIIIHYCYLSSFFWLLIIAIHIYSTFNHHQTVREEKIHKENFRLFAYNILVWCSTGILILIACLIQFTNSQSSFSPNYGDLFCSISKPNAMILFFLVPIGFLLLIIAILFVKTILAIHHSHRIAKLANAPSSNNSFVVIYARLASLMGLQWILLIGALLIQQTWSWIVFEIINSLPGMFICLGFLCSPRLWSSIKQRIRTRLGTRRQPPRSNTTSTALMSVPLQR